MRHPAPVMPDEMRAILLASATATTFYGPPRQELRKPGIFWELCFARRNTECAPTTRMRRK